MTARRTGGPREVVTIRLSPAGLAAVDEIAEREERSRSEMIRKLLSEAVEARRKR